MGERSIKFALHLENWRPVKAGEPRGPSLAELGNPTPPQEGYWWVRIRFDHEGYLDWQPAGYFNGRWEFMDFEDGPFAYGHIAELGPYIGRKPAAMSDAAEEWFEVEFCYPGQSWTPVAESFDHGRRKPHRFATRIDAKLYVNAHKRWPKRIVRVTADGKREVL